MSDLLKGAPVAAAIAEDLSARIARLAERGVMPKLAVVRLGERGGDLFYERAVLRYAGKVGAQVESIVLPETAAQEELLDVIARVNGDDSIHGCLLLRPVPKHMDGFAVCEALRPEKDLDGMGTRALGALFAGQAGAFAPCTACSCMELLKHYEVPLSGARAVVLGRSLVIGRPVSQLLLAENATVTVCHSRSRDLPAICRAADVLIAAIGKPGFVGADFLREGQVVLDVGASMVDGVMRGDVDFEAAEPIVRAITPVPGGVGAVTTATLFKHLVEAAERA
ncbi:MAG: bifunctional 5,10-methylenetetrahydrofolate dehydrogenase/5,10-methenyltetrahydrofolate cyclohydrolase [Oscillospiraceae bacterium]|nr:bifunctional 5,10-methylenetetrahydrofolate dehydrogenase/5,10-methenyltetrahydrofolate cyclohydrolase [Oscillospiraceae bacterium]